MRHSFSVELALKIGIEKALIADNIAYWVANAKANNRNLNNGKFWVYNSTNSWLKLLPELRSDGKDDTKKLSRLLNELENKDKIIVSNNFNENKTDRTKWYTLSEEYEYLVYEHITKDDNADNNDTQNTFSKNKECISQIQENDVSNTRDDVSNTREPYLKNEKCIKNNNQRQFKPIQTTIQTNSNSIGGDEKISDANKKLQKQENKNLNLEAFEEWCEYKGKNYSSKGKSLSANFLSKYDKTTQMQMVESSIRNGYKGLFELKPPSTAELSEEERNRLMGLNSPNPFAFGLEKYMRNQNE